MPRSRRNKNLKKSRGGAQQGGVIEILDSDDDGGNDSDLCSNQIQQMSISPDTHHRPSMNHPAWGAGAAGPRTLEFTRSAGFSSQDSPAVQNVSDFISFLDSPSGLQPRSQAFADQMSHHSMAGLQKAPPLIQQFFMNTAQNVQTRLMSSQPGPSTASAQGMANQPSNPVHAPPLPLTSPPQQPPPPPPPHPKIVAKEFPVPSMRNGVVPGTKVTRDNQEAVIRKHHGRSRLYDQEVDSSIQECIEILAKAGNHVSLELLEKTIIEKYQVRQFSHLGLNCRQFDKMPAVFNHSRVLGKVISYAHSFVRARSMCTLYELGECMKEFHKDKQGFDQLLLGPLHAMPFSYQLFKFPSDEYVPEITCIDIIEHLNCYLDKYQLWTKQVEFDGFLEYLIAVYQVESPFSLGVRIRSMPLALQMLKKSKRDAGSSRREMLTNLNSILTKDISMAISNFRDQILKFEKDSVPELKLHYTKLAPAEALAEIYCKFEMLSSLMEGEGSLAMNNKMKKFHHSFASFKKCIDSDPFTRQLFHLAVCLTATEVQETALEFLEEMKESKNTTAVPTKSDQATKPKPPQSALVEKIIQYISMCLQDGSLLLSHLDRIEKKVVEFFKADSFDELTARGFLSFLLSKPKIKELLDDCGGAMLGSASAAGADRCFHPTFSDLKELVCQAKLAGVTQVPQFASIVQEQFGVKEVKTLGHGSIARLHTAATAPGNHSSPDYNCHFEAALCGRSFVSTHSTQGVGCLGNQSREKATAVLTSCPLLEDMGRWSQWDLVFQPQHGNLKDFVARYGGRKIISIAGGKQEVMADFSALETEPGKLLKISSQSTADVFNEALSEGNPVLAAGHLASLIAESKGVESAPLALLANHMKDKLLSLRAQQGVITTSSDSQDPKVVFVTIMLMKLPLRLCAAVANQVLLDPLSQVVGSAKSKACVMQACQLPWERDRLETLGILLGIPEWTRSLQEKMTFPSHLVVDVVVDDLFGQALVDDDDEEEEVVDEPGEEEEETEESSEDYDDSDEEEDDIDINLSDGDVEQKQTAEMSKNSDKEDVEQDGVGAEKEKEDSADDTSSQDESEKDVCGKQTCDGDKVSTLEEHGKTGDDQESSGHKTDTGPQELVTGTGGKEAEKAQEGEEEKEEEGRSVAPQTREDVCRQIVDNIRREEFGVGIKLNEEAAKLMKTQQERQGRSLQRLSKDLYSKDTHFVLELIQNADDNPYSDGTLPSLNFVIDPSGVTIQNNELGFEENNIRALCDVGKSTKSKHQAGYIGQKGIGFKSVFRVTDRPEIHSNGFHICFDVKSGPMGYIMPHWVGQKPSDQNDWKTQIMLSWTDEIKDQIQTHAARFNDIQPSLLLFLHRLRKISIFNKVEGCEMVMKREDFPTGEVQISHSDRVDRWLVVRKVLDAANVSMEAKSGVDVQSTEIALAFPLREKADSMLHHQTRPEQLPVFAFLPLQSYGFRFIVQGDFNVPSSRECVDKDSPWNQWLRDKIPSLFIDAWDNFVNLPGMSAMEAFISYFQFIPLEGEVMGFFSPITSHIRTQLVAKDCMPVVGPSGKKEDIMWKAPSKTVMTHNNLVREIISPQLLLRNLGLYYLHWQVLESLEHGMLQALGVNTISTDHLLQIGQGVSAHWDDTGNTNQVTELAKWMACVYCSLDLFKENTQVFDRLKTMRIIPLSDGRLVSLEDTTVFMLTHDKALKGSSSDRLQPLRRDVNIIHPALTSTPDPEVNSQVTKLLSHAEIKEMSPTELIYSHVLPVLSSDAWKEKSREVLISYLVCAKHVLFDGQEDLSKLREVARVVTSQGVKLPTEDNVHFHRGYGCPADLEQLFPKLVWTVVDPSYLPSKPTKADLQSWRSFFTQLGVREFLCVNKIQVPLDRANLMQSPWAVYKDLWQDFPYESFVVEDFCCEEFHTLVTNTDGAATFETMCRLYQLLEKFWNTYKTFTGARLLTQDGSVLKENIDSSFGLHLKNKQWVPATWANFVSETELFQDRGLLTPCQLYYRHHQVEKLLAHTAKYLAVDGASANAFTNFLQVRNSVQKNDVKEALISWGQRSEKKPNTPANFTTKYDHIIAVYEYLQNMFTPGEIQNLFHTHPIIFIASGVSRMGIASGQMMRREEMWWLDSCGLITKYRESLEKYNSDLVKFKCMLPFYRGKEELFQIARIDPTHNVIHLAELLKHITSVFTLDDDVLHDVLCLFSAIGHGLSLVDEMEAGVKTLSAQLAVGHQGKVQSLLQDCAIFPTKALKLISLKEQPMIADNKEWEKMFDGKPQVHFLLLDSPKLVTNRRQHPTPQRHRRGGNQAPDPIDSEMVQCFLDLFKEIRPLSSCVTWEQITSGFKPCAKGQEYLHEIVGVLQQFLFFSFPDVYTEFKTNNAHHLSELLFTEVDRLEVRYELKDWPDTFELRTENCIVNGNHFYFSAKNIQNQSEINKEVARFFSKDNEECVREIRNFLSQAVPILEGKSNESLQDLLARQRFHIEQLPEDEPVWEIPLPVIPSSVKLPQPLHYQHGLDTREDIYASGQPVPQGEGSQGDGTMKSWPPRSNADYQPQPNMNKPAVPRKPSKFLPPEAPDYIKAKQIPSNIKFVNEQEGDDAGGEKREGDNVEGGVRGEPDTLQGRTSSLSDQSNASGGRADGQPGVFQARSATVEWTSSGGQIGPTGQSGLSGPTLVRTVSVEGREIQEGQDEATFRGKRKMTESLSLSEDGLSSKKQSLEVVKDTPQAEPSQGGRVDGDRLVQRNRLPSVQYSQGLVAVSSRPRDGVPMEIPDGEGGHRPHGQDRGNRRDKPRLQFNIPLWNDQVDTTSFTELTSDISKIKPQERLLAEHDQNLEVGRWGEMLVHNYLRHEKESNPSIEDIIWANSEEEKGLPYDFEMIFKMDSAEDQEFYSVFVEVKTTRSNDKAVFEISSGQVEFALNFKERYQILRVYGAGQDSLRLVRVDNIADRLKTKSVQLLMVI